MCYNSYLCSFSPVRVHDVLHPIDLVFFTKHRHILVAIGIRSRPEAALVPAMRPAQRDRKEVWGGGILKLTLQWNLPTIDMIVTKTSPTHHLQLWARVTVFKKKCTWYYIQV